MSGDYQAQRNVAFCLATGCGKAAIVDRVRGCAMRHVIIGAAHPEADASDAANLVQDCGSLSTEDRMKARQVSRSLFKEIYRRELPY